MGIGQIFIEISVKFNIDIIFYKYNMCIRLCL